MRSPLKTGIEAILFGSRWLMVPIYLGLVSALGLILVKFTMELIEDWTHVIDHSTSDAILAILGLIDLSLAANLVLMVILAGYESFVSKIGSGDHEDRPDWMDKINFSGLKLKLVASIIAISAIHLLEVFMNLSHYTPEKVYLYVIVHLTFVISGTFMAATDYIIGRTAAHD
jgi:uncharacterized protein (TIGR00645 family)